MPDSRPDLRPSPRTWYWVLHVPVFWACVSLLGVIFLTGSGLGFALGWMFPRETVKRLMRGGISIAFRCYLSVLTVLGVARFDLKALDALNDEPGIIIAPNHLSMIDVVLITSRVRQASCLMKAALWDSIFLGAGARVARYIRNDSLESTTRLAVAELRAGGRLLMFPEGTRTERPPINPLKAGVVLIAQQAKAPIQTVILETNSPQPYIGKGWPLFRPPNFPFVFRARLGQRFEAPQQVLPTLRAMQQYFESELTKSSSQTSHESN